MLHSHLEMRPVNQITNAIRYFFNAFAVVGRARWRWIYVLPFIVYLMVLFTGFYFTGDLHENAMAFLREMTQGIENKNAFYRFLFSATSLLTWLVIKIGLFVLMGMISASITIIVLSPVFAWLSEKTEEQLKGVTYPFNLQKFLKDILRAVVIAVRNGALQLSLTFILFLLSFIPVLNLVTAPLLFFLSAYFYGFSFLDYTHERMGFTMKKSISEVRKLKFSAIALGGIFLFLNMLPWIGPFVASLFSFHLVIAGTTLVLEANSE